MGIKNADAEHQEAGKKPQAAVHQHFRIKRVKLKCRIDKIQQDKPCDDDDTSSLHCDLL